MAMEPNPGCGETDADQDMNSSEETSDSGQGSLQNEVDDVIEMYGGKQISDNEVTLANGSDILTIEDKNQQPPRENWIGATNRHNCPNGWWCFYDYTNFGGRRLQFSDCSTQKLSDYGFNNVTSSWVNHSSRKISQCIGMDRCRSGILSPFAIASFDGFKVKPE